tara:strand:- start:676 stop:1080 length:405 start_codon:yes stop_codon:yes gene_type:complete
MEEKRKVELLLDHMGSSVTHDYNDMFNCDYQLISESTADGYEVYAFKEPNEEYNIGENIYYYNTGLGERIVEELMIGNTTVFLDDLEYDGLFIEDLLVEEFEEYVDDILQDETLPVNEVKELMEEYDIELNIEL